MRQEETTGFSIVVCTHNGVARLRPTLEHLARLQVPADYSTELILVDNASTDGTADFASAAWRELGAPYPLLVLAEKRPGKGFAVETGYDAATCSCVLTVDDDNWLDEHYLTKSIELFAAHPTVSILQGFSEAVFESAPPSWFADPQMAKQLVVGGQLAESGYFPKGDFHIWGAGLVICRKDWAYLRQRGFAFLTSKVPGKAAGEDSELGLALSLLGRKAYYSSELKFKHFMPESRLDWRKIKNNFDTFGYVSYYFALYAAVIAATEAGKQPRLSAVKKYILAALFKQFKLLTVKQHAAFWLMPREEYYQLLLTEYYSRLRWMFKLSDTLRKDIDTIKAWLDPLIRERGK